MNRQHEENIARLASLETDVRNLSQDVRLLATSLQTVTDRMAARDRPNWQMLGVAVVIIGAIGAAVITPRTRQSGCGIKGNIISKGERIYHVPGGRYFANTLIDSARGERWFCSEAEAPAAGWRPPKQ